MPDDIVQERLEITLGYEDFITSLKKMSGAYNDTIKRMSNIGGDIGKNLTTNVRQAINSVNSIGKSSADAIKNTLGSVNRDLQDTHSKTIKMQDEAKKGYSDINKLIQERGKILASQYKTPETHMATPQKTITKEEFFADPKRQWLTEQMKQFAWDMEQERLQKQIAANSEFFKGTIKDFINNREKLLSENASKIEKIEENLYRNLSKYSADSSKSLVDSTKGAIETLGKSTQSVSTQFQKMFTKSGDIQNDVERLVSGKRVIDNLKKMQQDAGKEIQLINKQQLDAQKALDVARISSNYFVNKQIALNNTQAAEVEKQLINEGLQKKYIAYDEFGKIIKRHDGNKEVYDKAELEHFEKREARKLELFVERQKAIEAGTVKSYAMDIALSEKNYQIALANQNRLTELQNKAFEKYKSLSTKISEGTGLYPTKLKETGKEIEAGFGTSISSYKSNLEALKYLYRELLVEFFKTGTVGKDTWTSFKQLLKGVNSDLAADSQQMKTFVSLMEQLKSVGLSGAGLKIKGMKENISEIEAVKKQIMSAVGEFSKLNFAGPLKNATENFKAFGDTSHNILGNIVRELKGISISGITTPEGISKSIDYWSNLSSHAKEAKGVISNIEKEITRLTREEANYRAKSEVDSTSIRSQTFATYANMIKSRIRELESLKSSFQAKIPFQEYAGKSIPFPALAGKITAGTTTGFNESLSNAKLLVSDLTNKFDLMLQSVTQFGTLGRGDIQAFYGEFKTVGSILNDQIRELRIYVELLNKLKAAGDIRVGAKIDDFNKLISNLELFRKELGEAIKATSQLNFSGPLRDADIRFGQLADKAEVAFAKIKEAQNRWNSKLKEQPKMFETSFGILQGSRLVSSMASEETEIKNVLASIGREKARLTSYYEELSARAISESNAKKAASYAAYADAVKMHITALNLKQTEFESKLKSASIDNYVSKLKGSAQEFSKSIKNQISDWSDVRNIVQVMGHHFDEIKKQTTRYGQSNREAAQSAKNALDSWGQSFVIQRHNLMQWIKDLERLTREAPRKAQLINAEEQIQTLKNLLTDYNGYVGKVRQMMAGSAKFVDSQQREMEKSIWRRGYESLRNFRWQVAGMLYLVGVFARGVERFFISAFENVDNFRKNVYAVTASVGLSVGRDFGKYYNDIYNYSTNLAERLQAKVGQTYASLEDMMMVVRSVTQGGIFVRTDEDVNRIATLATAVKVMTEGMANAGVQMRQEIMALIEGRQRVTDSVAIAFKMQGIDIKKEMNKWAAEGKSKLQGFAELLEPFARINKEISKEYGVQVQNLKNLWDYISRIANTKLTLSIGGDIKDFVELFRNPKGQLTDLGKEAVAALGASFQVVWQIVLSVVELLKQVGRSLADIGKSFYAISGFVNDSKDGLGEFGQTLYGLLRIIMAIEFAIVTAFSPIKMAIKWVEAIFFEFSALYKLLSGNLSGAMKDWEQSQKVFAESFRDYPKYVNEYEKRLISMYGKIKDFEDAMKNIGKTQKDNTDGLFDYLNVTTGILKTITEFENIYDKALDKKGKANKQIEEIDAKYNAQMKAAENLLNNLNKLLIESTNWGISENERLVRDTLKKSKETGLAILDNYGKTTEFMISANDIVSIELARMEEQSAEHMEKVSSWLSTIVGQDVANAIEKWTKYLRFASDIHSGSFITDIDNETDNKPKPPKRIPVPKPQLGPTKTQNDLKDLQDRINNVKKQMGDLTTAHDNAVQAVFDKANKSTKTLIDMWDEYMGLLDKFNKINPIAKVTYDYWKDLADIEKAAQENLYVQEHYYELLDAAREKWIHNTELAFAEAKDIYDDFSRKIRGLELTEDEKITEAFKNYRNEIEASNKLLDEQKQKLLSQLPAHEAIQRAEMHKLALLEAQVEYYDVFSKKSELLGMSTNYNNKRVAETLKLQVDYAKFVTEGVKKLEETKKKYGPDSEELAKAKDRFERLNELTKNVLDEQLKDVWNPFYKDLKEMQDGWANSVSSTLTDILFDTTDWKTKITDVFKDISKQIIEAFIKRKLIEPMFDSFDNLMSKVSSGKESDWGVFGKILGLGSDWKKESASIFNEITMGKPLPVFVTNVSSETNPLGGIAGSFEDLFSPISKNFTSVSNTYDYLFGNTFQTGGHIPGYGGGDKVPAMLEEGEYVIRKESVKHFGKRFFDRVNNSGIVKRQEGGIIDYFIDLFSPSSAEAAFIGKNSPLFENMTNKFKNPYTGELMAEFSDFIQTINPNMDAVVKRIFESGKPENYYLTDIIPGSKIFDYYPFLKEWTVELSNRANSGTEFEHKNFALSVGELSEKYYKSFNLKYPQYLGSLEHEIQHAISYYEDWPSGGNLSVARYFNTRTMWGLKKLSDMDTYERFLGEVFSNEASNRSVFTDLEKSLNKPFEAMFKKYSKDDVLSFSYEKLWDILGKDKSTMPYNKYKEPLNTRVTNSIRSLLGYQFGGLVEDFDPYNSSFMDFMKYTPTEDDILNVLDFYSKSVFNTRDMIYSLFLDPYHAFENMLSSMGKGERFTPTGYLLEGLVGLGGDAPLWKEFSSIAKESYLGLKGLGINNDIFTLGILANVPDVLKALDRDASIMGGVRKTLYENIPEGAFSSLFDKKMYIELSDHLLEVVGGIPDYSKISSSANPLEDIIKHPEFYNIFGEDKAKGFTFLWSLLEEGTLGQVDKSLKSLTLNIKYYQNKSLEEILSTATHELSHVGEVTPGGNRFVGLSSFRDLIEERLAEINPEFASYKVSTPIKYYIPEKGTYEWEKYYGSYADSNKLKEGIPIITSDWGGEQSTKFNNMIDDELTRLTKEFESFPENKYKDFTYFLYQNLIGETYARDASLRRLLTPEERRFNLLPHPLAGTEGIASDARWSVLSTENMKLENALEFKGLFKKDEWPDFKEWYEWYKKIRENWDKVAYGYTIKDESGKDVFLVNSFEKIMDIAKDKDLIYSIGYSLKEKMFDSKGANYFSVYQWKDDLLKKFDLKDYRDIGMTAYANLPYNKKYLYVYDIMEALRRLDLDFIDNDPRIKEFLIDKGFKGIRGTFSKARTGYFSEEDAFYRFFDDSPIRSYREMFSRFDSSDLDYQRYIYDQSLENFSFQSGGHLSGYGGGDTVPALLEAGEYVVRKEAVKGYGKEFFDSINQMQLIKRATGGAVTSGFSTFMNSLQIGQTLSGLTSQILGLFGFGGSKKGGGLSLGYTATNPLPVFVVNINKSGGLGEGVSGLVSGGKGIFSSMFDKFFTPKEDSVTKSIKNMDEFSKSTIMTTKNFGDLSNISSSLSGGSKSGGFFDSIKNMFSGIWGYIKDLMSGIGSGIGSLFSGGSNLFGSIFSSIGSLFSFDEGGELKEPVFGVGLKSGTAYSFAEKEPELFTPASKLKQFENGTPAETTNVHVNFSINAIDTRSGTEFLVQNSKTLEGLIGKAVRSNKPIRGSIRNSY